MKVKNMVYVNLSFRDRMCLCPSTPALSANACHGGIKVDTSPHGLFSQDHCVGDKPQTRNLGPTYSHPPGAWV